jgi:hypothetical protein
MTDQHEFETMPIEQVGDVGYPIIEEAFVDASSQNTAKQLLDTLAAHAQGTTPSGQWGTYSIDDLRSRYDQLLEAIPSQQRDRVEPVFSALFKRVGQTATARS